MRCAAVKRVDKACTFEREVEHRFQGVVKNRIAGMVGEVRDQDAYGLVSDLCRRTGEELSWQADTCDGQEEHHGNDRRVFPNGFVHYQRHECLIGDGTDKRRRNSQPRFQMLGKLLRRRETTFRLDFERLCDDIAERLWNGWI